MTHTREELLAACRAAQAKPLESNLAADAYVASGQFMRAARTVSVELNRRLIAEKWHTDFEPLIHQSGKVWVAYANGDVCAEDASVAWATRGVTHSFWKQIAWRPRDPAPEFPSHLLAPADSQRVADGLVEP